MPRRRPHGFYERLTTSIESMIPGTLGGRVSSASPVFAVEGRATGRGDASVIAGTPAVPSPAKDTFVATASQTVFTLSYLPIENADFSSVLVLQNGLGLTEGVEYDVDFSVGTVTLDTGASVSDRVTIQYWTNGIAPADELGDYPAAVLANSPLVYYRMNGTGTSETDLSGNGRDGTMTGHYLRSRPSLLANDSDPSTDLGNSSQGSTNPGSGAGYVVCPYDAGLLTSDWSFELWTNKGSSSATTCLQWTGRLRLELGATWNVRFYTDPSTHALVGSSSTGLLSGTDYIGGSHHLVVTFDNSANELTFYKDGTQFGLTVTGVTASLLSTTNDINLGYNDGFDGLCDGDEFAFYGTCLSAADVAAHYAAA